MRYRLLGRSGIRVSELCLGTMTFGDDWGWGAPKDTCARILDSFADAGGNFVDTADKYTNGTSEAILGELLGNRRDRFVLASKYTLERDPTDLNSAGNHRKNLVASLEASLRRLRTDHLDVYWVHARDDWTPVPELMRALDDQVRAGKVLHVGVRTGPPGRSARPTRSPSCAGGRRSSRCKWSTRCSSARRNATCCPWPGRSTSRSPPGRHWRRAC